MAYRVINFPVQFSRSVDSLIFGARVAVTDVLRTEARRAMDSAASAGIDAYSAGQRLAFLFQNAAGASRFLRAYPGALARWAFRMESEARSLAAEGYTAAPGRAIGSYGPRWLTVMPNDAVLVTAGGLRAVGTAPAFPQAQVHEVRLFEVGRTPEQFVANAATTYACEIVLSDYAGDRAPSEDPMDAEPSDHEREDA